MNCPAPRHTRNGELECPACGRTWDALDGAPECAGPVDRSKEVGRRELAKIRQILARPRS